MPEGDVHLAGLDTHVSRKQFPFVLAGVGIVAFLALRSRGSAPSAPSGVAGSVAAAQTASDQTSLEFARIQSEAQVQLAQLAASNAIEQQQLNQGYQLAAGLNPGLQTQCISITTWYNTGEDIRRNLVQQVRDGQLYMSIGTQGVCFAPTQTGIQGHPPIISNKQGLFSSTSKGYPGTAGTPPPPAVVGILGQVLPYGY